MHERFKGRKVGDLHFLRPLWSGHIPIFQGKKITLPPPEGELSHYLKLYELGFTLFLFENVFHNRIEIHLAPYYPIHC